MRSNLPMLRYRRRRAAPLPPGLFSAGEVGFWSDVQPSRLWQDTARTTPVTAPAQTVASWLLGTSANGAIYAEQSTAGERPTYGIEPWTGRRNLLTRTEQFDNAAWAKVNLTVTPNAGAAPDGTATAEKLVETTATNAFHQTLQLSAGATATTHTVSVYAKAAERNGVAVLMDDNSGLNFAFAQFNLSAGTAGAIQYAGSGYSAGSTSIVAVGDGWYRCTITASRAVAYAARAYVEINDGSTRQYTGNTSSGILIWGAQLEAGSTATPYQRVVTQFEVTEVNVASIGYLFCGGSASPRWLVTPTITPGTDKVQVFAGVRKLSDAAVGTVFSYGDSTSATNRLQLFAPRTAPSGDFGIRAFNSAPSPIDVTSATFPAPTTTVLTGLWDAAAAASTQMVLRRNGVEVGIGGTGITVGGSLAITIGRRGTDLPLNGHLYGLIVRFGPNLDAATIAATERWMASKTGVTL